MNGYLYIFQFFNGITGEIIKSYLHEIYSAKKFDYMKLDDLEGSMMGKFSSIAECTYAEFLGIIENNDSFDWGDIGLFESRKIFHNYNTYLDGIKNSMVYMHIFDSGYLYIYTKDKNIALRLECLSNLDESYYSDINDLPYHD